MTKPDVSVAATDVVPRPSMLGQGLASGALAAALLGLALAGDLPLLGGVVVVQVLMALGFLALVEAPAGGGVFLLSAGAAVAADVVVWVDDGAVGGLAGVVAVALVAGLLHQLCRRERSRVAESLADMFVVVVLGCSTVSLLAAQLHPEGTWVLRAGLAAAGVALLTGRVGDAVIHRPALALGATRAWPGLLLSLGAGVAVAVLVAQDHLENGQAALLGLAVSAAVATADLAIDLAASELTDAPDDARRVAALRPVSVLLPFTVLGPVVLLAVRLLESI